MGEQPAQELDPTYLTAFAFVLNITTQHEYSRLQLTDWNLMNFIDDMDARIRSFVRQTSYLGAFFSYELFERVREIQYGYLDVTSSLPFNMRASL